MTETTPTKWKTTIYDNPWTFKGQTVTDDLVEGFAGFVYLITNKTTGRKYVGKKILKNSKKLHRKTGRKVRRVIVDSDWKKYYGSNDILNEERKTSGNDIFIREILYLCKTKKEMTYLETLEQFLRDVIHSEDYYNSNIGGKYFRTEKTWVAAYAWDITLKPLEIEHVSPQEQECTC